MHKCVLESHQTSLQHRRDDLIFGQYVLTEQVKVSSFNLHDPLNKQIYAQKERGDLNYYNENIRQHNTEQCVASNWDRFTVQLLKS